jgi:hypothetical protein
MMQTPMNCLGSYLVNLPGLCQKPVFRTLALEVNLLPTGSLTRHKMRTVFRRREAEGVLPNAAKLYVEYQFLLGCAAGNQYRRGPIKTSPGHGSTGLGSWIVQIRIVGIIQRVPDLGDPLNWHDYAVFRKADPERHLFVRHDLGKEHVNHLRRCKPKMIPDRGCQIHRQSLARRSLLRRDSIASAQIAQW